MCQMVICVCFLMGFFAGSTQLEASLQITPGRNLHDWSSSVLMQPQVPQPAKTAVLIIAPPSTFEPPTEEHFFLVNRWKIGEKVWEQYMDSHPNVDCYFIVYTNQRKDRGRDDQVWLEGNTIYIGDEYFDQYQSDRILHKTILAMEWLISKNYTHFIRTNLNTFLDLDLADRFMQTHHQSFFSTPMWQEAWYTVGYSIWFTADVARHIVQEYHRIGAENYELVSHHRADDGMITILATGIEPYYAIHPFSPCPSLPVGVRQWMCEDSFYKTRLNELAAWLAPPINFHDTMKYCQQAPSTVLIYRTAGGLNLTELGQYYNYLLARHYPHLNVQDIHEYAAQLEVHNDLQFE